MRAAPGQMASCVVRWPYFYPTASRLDTPLRLPKGWVRMFVIESGEDPKKRAGVRAQRGRTSFRPLCSSSDAFWRRSVGVNEKAVDLLLHRVVDLRFQHRQSPGDCQLLTDDRSSRVDRVATGSTTRLEVVLPQIQLRHRHSLDVILDEVNGQDDVHVLLHCLPH